MNAADGKPDETLGGLRLGPFDPDEIRWRCLPLRVILLNNAAFTVEAGVSEIPVSDEYEIVTMLLRAPKGEGEALLLDLLNDVAIRRASGSKAEFKWASVIEEARLDDGDYAELLNVAELPHVKTQGA